MTSAEAQTLASKLRALANERRLQILSCIKKHKSATVTRIAESVGISVEATSQHLRTLRLTGIVTRRRRGMYSSYRLNLKQEEPARSVIKSL